MRTLIGNEIRLLVLASALLALAGCQRLATPGTGSEEPGVPLLVVEGRSGSTLALAPVFINGQGPFAFALDTGASHSVIDQELAEELKLPAAGPNVKVTGVATTAEAEQLQMDSWRVGDVPLPGNTIVSLGMAQTNHGVKLRGLLGSDVLSRFGAITVDYDRQRLFLRARPQP